MELLATAVKGLGDSHAARVLNSILAGAQNLDQARQRLDGLQKFDGRFVSLAAQLQPKSDLNCALWPSR